MAKRSGDTALDSARDASTAAWRFASRRTLQKPARREKQNAYRNTRAFTLIECVVYIAVLMVILTLVATVHYRVDWNNRNLVRNADDIVRALKAGEQWREDVRAARGPVVVTPTAEGDMVALPHAGGTVRYAFRRETVWRQAGENARWVPALSGVLNSRMEKEARQFTTAWRWEVELRSRQKVARVRPLFTFQAATKETEP